MNGQIQGFRNLEKGFSMFAIIAKELSMTDT
jgi:hypothetical protein